MIKNAFLRKTLYYLVIVIGVILFGIWFGYENVFYAVTSCLIINRLRPKAVKLGIFYRYLLINILMFITTLCLQFHSWWNVLLIFTVIYLIIKCFYIDRNTVAYFPFLVQFVFIIFKPISDLTTTFIVNRAITLAVGPLILLLIVLYNMRRYNPQTYIDQLVSKLGTSDFHKALSVINGLFTDKFRETKDINRYVVELNCLKIINFYYHQLPTPITNIEDIYNYDLTTIHTYEARQAFIMFKQAHQFDGPITTYYKVVNNEKIWFSVIFSCIFTLVVVSGKWLYGYETRWFLIGLCAMLFPFYEDSVKKIRNLLIATFFGGIVVMGVANIFPYHYWPLTLLLICFYLATLSTDFVRQKFFVTMGSILLILVVNSGDPIKLAIIRILLFMLAGCISLIINKLFALDALGLKRQQRRFYDRLYTRLCSCERVTQLNYDSLKLYTINLYLNNDEQQHQVDLKVLKMYKHLLEEHHLH